MIGLGLLVVKTREPENLAIFYAKLGIQFKKHQHGKGPIHFAAELGEVVFEIYPLPKSHDKADDTTRLGFKVEELDKLMFQLKNEGINVISEPKNYPWGYSAIIKDPDGRKIELTEAKEPKNLPIL